MKNTASSLGRTQNLSRCLIALSAAVTVAIVTRPTHAQIFDFENISTNSQVIALPTLIGDFDLNGDINAAIEAQPIGQRAVKVTGTGLTEAQAATWFEANGANIDLVFADFETNGSLIATKTLVNQAGSGRTVGNFSYDPLFPDPTRPAPQNVGDISKSAYAQLGVRMSNENLYPGSPSFETTTTPNIRSGLFLNPIKRFTGVEEQRGTTTTIFNTEFDVFKTDDKHIPYVTRFNNAGQPAGSLLNTGLEVGDDPRVGDSENIFDARNGATNANQLLSRGDFSAQIAHYHARGADGVVLFQPGVIGYTKEQMQTDAVDGWNIFDPILNASGDANIATLATQITIDGVDATDIGEKGVVYSGLYSDSALMILLSNLDEVSHTATLDEINGLGYDGLDFNINDSTDPTFSIGAGEHLLLQFLLVTDPGNGNAPLGWGFGLVESVFTDDIRTGIGVPEPASLLMLGMGCLLIGLPRSRRRV